MRPASLAVLGFGSLFLTTSITAQCEVQALRGLNTTTKDFFGKSCDMEGDRLVVGAFAATTGRPGSVHVFELVGDEWVQRARLVHSDGGGGDELGNSVGISGDWVIAGAEYYDGPAGSNSGAAYLWRRGADGKWSEVQKLVPDDSEAQDNFGEYVAIEGDVAVVGERFDEARGNNTGAAYVFERGPGDVWVQTAKLVGSQAARNDLSADTLAVEGGRILMASYRSDASGGHSGSAYLFEKIGGSWTETAHLVANDGAGEMSRGVAMHGDRIVLGARLESTNGGAAGAGYVFEKWNGSWIQTAKLVPASAKELDWVGEAVAVQGDRIVLSGHHHDQVGSNSGAAFVYELKDGQWVETKKLVSSAISPNDEFSFALSLSGDRLLATSPFDTSNRGSAYVFTFDPVLCDCSDASGGTATPFGEGLGGANIGTLAALSPPNPGSLMQFAIGGIPSGTTGTLFIATQKVRRLSLGGTLLVATGTAPIRLPFRLSQGEALVNWNIPVGLCGRMLYAQGIALDPTQPNGRALTNGLELVLGK